MSSASALRTQRANKKQKITRLTFGCVSRVFILYGLLLEQILVKSYVFVSGLAPAVVALHGALYEYAPALTVLIALNRTAYCVEHIVSVVARKREAVALTVAAVLYRIAQTAVSRTIGTEP